MKKGLLTSVLFFVIMLSPIVAAAHHEPIVDASVSSVSSVTATTPAQETAALAQSGGDTGSFLLWFGALALLALGHHTNRFETARSPQFPKPKE